MSDAQSEDLARQGVTDRFVGRAKELLGQAVGSQQLVAKGRLQQEEGAAKQTAAHLQSEAEVQRYQAGQHALTGARDAAATRTEATEKERVRTAQVERERALQQQAAHIQAARQEDAVADAAAAEARALAAREDATRAQRDIALDDAAEVQAEAARAAEKAEQLERLQQDVQQS